MNTGPESSTIAAIVKLHDDITEQLDHKDTYACRVIAFDMSKAFDKVDHCKLLKVLNSLRFPLHFIEWISDYLTNRKQRVCLYGCKSDSVDVTSSVPQGTVLAPFLFSVYIASLKPVHPETTMYKYADDITMMFPFKAQIVYEDLVKMQAEIENITSWILEHNLVLNDDKLCSLTINTSKSIVIPHLPDAESDRLKFLGIILNNKLSWKDHIKYISKRACQRLHALRTLRPLLNQEELLQVFYASIRSIFDYGSPAFCALSAELNYELAKIQNRALYIIYGNNKPSITSISDRRKSISLNFFNKMKSKTNILHDLQPTTLPKSKKYSVPVHHTSRRRNSFLIYMIITINDG